MEVSIFACILGVIFRETLKAFIYPVSRPEEVIDPWSYMHNILLSNQLYRL